jgi:signal recognition particle receptor subunit beta
VTNRGFDGTLFDVQLNHAQRELTVKIVYYGPGLSGKTTNLQMIHQRTQPDVRGRLLTVETHDDRTLFFDLLPVFFNTASGFKVKVKLFTVPGQVIHNATRRIVLQGADAVAFIADSRRSASPENNSYWKNLNENMRENGLDPAHVPIVIQFNKRDLPDTRTDAEIEEARKKGKEPSSAPSRFVAWACSRRCSPCCSRPTAASTRAPGCRRTFSWASVSSSPRSSRTSTPAAPSSRGCSRHG